jgi:hypothetical protein
MEAWRGVLSRKAVRRDRPGRIGYHDAMSVLIAGHRALVAFVATADEDKAMKMVENAA